MDTKSTLFNKSFIADFADCLEIIVIKFLLLIKSPLSHSQSKKTTLDISIAATIVFQILQSILERIFLVLSQTYLRGADLQNEAQ